MLQMDHWRNPFIKRCRSGIDQHFENCHWGQNLCGSRKSQIDPSISQNEGKQIVSILKINRFDEFSLNIFQEAEGNVSEAAKIMQELQVETYGSMERREKVELILEQMRLCLATKDYIRAQIISKKISVRFFENTEHHQLKLKFYRYMIEMDENERSYLAICRHYR